MRRIDHFLQVPLYILSVTILFTENVALAQLNEQTLVRTRIHDRTICGLSGRRLQIAPSWPSPIRAWAGIVDVPDGGPAADALRTRSEATLKEVLLADERAGNEELNSRLRQCRNLTPRYFDGLLLEFPTPIPGEGRFCWVIDYDIDGSLADETLHFPGDPDFDSPANHGRKNEEYIVVTYLKGDKAVAARFNWNAVIVENDPNEKAQKSITSANQRPPRQLVVPFGAEDLQMRLHKLDHIRTRKKHLSQIVEIADELIVKIDANNSDEGFNAALSDVLYRRGRALGYMELPDVVAVEPVSDQAWLNREFEATFSRLRKLVDVNAPQYVLLHIRHERRVGRRGIALDLVDVYRKTHPHPVWHFKKRFDLFNELGAKLHAHQAACEMWLNAKLPAQPQCFIFRLSGTEESPIPNVTGSWSPKPPWRDTDIQFQQVSPTHREGVVWLDSPHFTLDGATLGERQDAQTLFGSQEIPKTCVMELKKP